MPEDQEFEDGLALLKANIDQMVMLAPDVARAAAAWYQAFINEGFEPTQALHLTVCQIQGEPGTAP